MAEVSNGIIVTWTHLTKQLCARFNDNVNQYPELALGIIIAISVSGGLPENDMVGLTLSFWHFHRLEVGGDQRRTVRSYHSGSP